MEKELTAVIDRFEDEKAVLKFPDNQTLVVPIEFLPEGAGEGSVLEISFNDDQSAKEKKENLAKALLNEILKRDKS